VKAIPLVACIIVIIGSGVGAWFMYDANLELVTKLGQAVSNRNASEKALAEAEGELAQWKALAGAPRKFLLDSYVNAANFGAGDEKTLRAVIALRKAERDRALAELSSLRKRRDEAASNVQGTYRTLGSSAKDLNRQIVSSIGRWFTLAGELDVAVKRLANDIVNSAEESKRANETFRKERSKWKLDKAKLSEDMKFMTTQLTKFQEDLNPQVHLLDEPDAVVISADFGRSFVVLNIGHNQGAKPGMVFVIFRKTSEGHILQKGSVRISTVHDDYSEAGILEAEKAHPIIQGDFAQSPEFPQRLKYFLYGEFGVAATHDYTRDEIKKLVVGSGGIVAKDIDITVDVVILGDIAKVEVSEEFVRVLSIAREFQIKLMRVPVFIQELKK